MHAHKAGRRRGREPGATVPVREGKSLTSSLTQSAFAILLATVFVVIRYSHPWSERETCHGEASTFRGFTPWCNTSSVALVVSCDSRRAVRAPLGTLIVPDAFLPISRGHGGGAHPRVTVAGSKARDPRSRPSEPTHALHRRGQTNTKGAPASSDVSTRGGRPPPRRSPFCSRIGSYRVKDGGELYLSGESSGARLSHRKPKADPMAKRNPVIPGPTHLSRTVRYVTTCGPNWDRLWASYTPSRCSAGSRQGKGVARFPRVRGH
jgi:hypothetical protein